MGQWPSIRGWGRCGGPGRRTARARREPPGGAEPAYAPELNSVERFFQKLRRALGDRDPSLEAKKEALEPILRVRQAFGAGAATVRLGLEPGHPDPPTL